MAEVAIIGLGFVGGAMFKSFSEKGVNVYGYDKYKDGGIGNIETCMHANMIFLCLPTLYDEKTEEYDKSAIHEVIGILHKTKYNGVVIMKSTVEPGTISNLILQYNGIRLIHNPEFLTARTAYHDFHNQKRIILGASHSVIREELDMVHKFYHKLYPQAEIILCNSDESECMKIFVNCFYASKIQLFNEFYMICDHMNLDFNTIKDLMLGNGWINNRHTSVPGPDGKFSYGGACFPKDTKALLAFMRREDLPYLALKGVVDERDQMRND